MKSERGILQTIVEWKIPIVSLIAEYFIGVLDMGISTEEGEAAVSGARNSNNTISSNGLGR